MLLARAVVASVAVYLVVFGLAAWMAPDRTGRYLLAFAGTPRLHWVELLLRAVAGAAFVVLSPGVEYSSAFLAVGWVLLLSTAGLVLVPWHWHRRFAQQSVPRALEHLPLVGAASVMAGALIVFALV